MLAPPAAPTRNSEKPQRRTMRIAILGASGRTGRHLVEQAVAQGHQVTAIVRNPDGLPSGLHGAVRLVQAEVMHPDAIAPALVDADTVVSALSGPGRAPSGVWSESTRSIVQAMREASLRRFIRHHRLDARRNRRRPLLPLHRQTDRPANVEGIRDRYAARRAADPRKRSRLDDHPRATPDRQAG